MEYPKVDTQAYSVLMMLYRGAVCPQPSIGWRGLAMTSALANVMAELDTAHRKLRKLRADNARLRGIIDEVTARAEAAEAERDTLAEMMVRYG